MRSLLIVLLALFSQSMAVAEPAEDIRTRDERYMAEGAELEIMRYIACTKKQNIDHKKGCRSEIVCSDYAGWPMGSLGINRSAAGEQALVNLLALNLGEGSEESRNCTMRIRGKSILPQLRKLDVTQAINHCAELLKKVIAESHEDYSMITPEQACRPKSSILFLRDRDVADIEAGKKCEPWNID